MSKVSKIIRRPTSWPIQKPIAFARWKLLQNRCSTSHYIWSERAHHTSSRLAVQWQKPRCPAMCSTQVHAQVKSSQKNTRKIQHIKGSMFYLPPIVHSKHADEIFRRTNRLFFPLFWIPMWCIMVIIERHGTVKISQKSDVFMILILRFSIQV